MLDFQTNSAQGIGGGYTMWIILAMMVVLFFFMNSGAKKRAKSTLEERERMIADLAEGTWVKTASGFYGKIVEVHSEVVILTSLTGEETVWDIKAITGAVEPNFGSIEESAEEDTDAGESENENYDSAVARNNDPETVDASDSESDSEKNTEMGNAIGTDSTNTDNKKDD